MLNPWVGVVQESKRKEDEKSVGRGKVFDCSGRKTINGGGCVMSALLRMRNGNTVSGKERNRDDNDVQYQNYGVA
jgi:hypothetical protein